MKTHIVLHHTATPQTTIASQEKSINTAHKGRGFPLSKLGWHIGYHYLIDLEGTVKQFRGDEEVGAHCKEQMMNYKGIGVSLVGNFEETTITSSQYSSLIKLLKDLKDKHKIPKENFGYHKMYKPTACPGRNILGIWNKILDDVFNEEPESDLAIWEKNILELARTTGVLVNSEGRVLDQHQLALILELIRKAKITADFK